MATDYKIRDEKLQYDINREAARRWASGRIDKYEYLTRENILPPYSSLAKALEKQTEKQLGVLNFILKKMNKILLNKIWLFFLEEKEFMINVNPDYFQWKL